MRRGLSSATLALLAACASPAQLPSPPYVMGRLEFDAVVGEMALSPDGGSLFAIDFDAGRVIRISTRDGEVKAEASVGRARSLALAPSGRRIYVVGPAKEGGRILSFYPTDLELDAGFTIPFEPSGVAVDERERVYVSSADAPGRVAVVDPAQRDIVTMWEAPSAGAAIAVTRSGRTLLAASCGVAPGTLMAVPLSGEGRDAALLRGQGIGGKFILCDGGRRAVFPSGLSIELDEDRPALEPTRRVGPFLCGTGLADRGELLAVRPDGTLALLRADARESARAPLQNLIATELAVDPRRGILFAFAGEPSTLAIVDGRPRVRGDLRFLDISDWIR
jgi:sugar lactone lactonase YvrE